MKKKRKPAAKKISEDAMRLEIARAAVLEQLRRDRPGKKPGEIAPESRDEAVLAAVWTLLNPAGAEGRESVRWTWTEPAEPIEGMPPIERVKVFTAHAHAGEPLTPSPDDLLRYYLLDIEHGGGIHVITDGFKMKEIGKDDEE